MIAIQLSKKRSKMKTYEEYIKYCKEFKENSGKVSRNEIEYTIEGYYIFSEEKQKYVFSTSVYQKASEMNSDGICHIYVSSTELVISPL